MTQPKIPNNVWKNAEKKIIAVTSHLIPLMGHVPWPWISNTSTPFAKLAFMDQEAAQESKLYLNFAFNNQKYCLETYLKIPKIGWYLPSKTTIFATQGYTIYIYTVFFPAIFWTKCSKSQFKVSCEFIRIWRQGHK